MPPSRTRATIPEVTHHFAAVNGTELHFVSAGATGTPVLLVHGFPETWWAFRSVVPILAASHRVFAVDLRGFGDSAVADDEPDSATVAADLHKLIEHLDVGPVHLTGQDLSGMATFRLAVAHPESVRSYTAIETALPGFGGEVLADPTQGGAWYIGALLAPGVDELLFAGRERQFIGEHLLPAYGAVAPDVSAADIEEFVRTYSRPGGFRGAIGQYRSLVHDGEDMKVTAGRWSPDVAVMTIGTAAGERVHAGLSAATDGNVRSSVVLDDVSHYAALQAPDRVADALVDFFKSVDR